MEVSTRCSGTMSLTRARGLNLPLLSVYVAMGRDIEVVPNDYKVSMDRAFIARYRLGFDFSTVYFDFDDTLIVRGKVYLPAIWFLYQCRNKGKKVILLTRHPEEIMSSLNRYAIASDLFSSIMHIGWNEKKSDRITERDAIFVDNAYQERSDVRRQCGIPVFDVDMLEMLLDWRG